MRITRSLGSFGAALALWVVAAQAHAQDDFSVDGYIALQEEANAVYDTMLALERSDPAWHDAAMEALNMRLDLVAYLGDWMRAGTMPDGMQASAEETRAYLYQNVVVIYADMGQCSSAESTTAQLMNVVERIDLGPSGDELVMESQAAVTRCEIAATEREDAERRASTDARGVAQLRINTARQAATAFSEMPQQMTADVPRVPRWSLVAAGGVAWVAAFVVDLSATPDEGDRAALDACEEAPRTECTPALAQQANDARTRQESIVLPTFALTALGAALVTTGFLWRRPIVVGEGATVTLHVSPNGVALTGRF